MTANTIKAGRLSRDVVASASRRLRSSDQAYEAGETPALQVCFG